MITPNQSIALYHLRRNPNHHKQTKHSLLSECGERCALGLIAEAFNITVRVGNLSNGDAYNALAEKLGTRYSLVYSLNDQFELNYEEVADVMEEVWSAFDFNIDDLDNVLREKKLWKYKP